MNGRFTSRGMKTFASSPAAAAYAAIALAAFPADGTDRVFAPRYFARVTAADSPRALNEWCPSFAQCQRFFPVEQRQQLAVAPHVRRPSRERVAPPLARANEIVANE